jgi:hypothetical protein
LKPLQRAAWIAFIAHLIAGFAMAVVLRRGLETTPDLHERMAFIVNHRAWWTMSWLTWGAAAIAIFYFYMTFAEAHKLPSRFAVWLTVAAIGADLAGQSIEIGVLPTLVMPDLFVIAHRIAVMLSGFVANTLYSATALLLTLGARSRYPTWISVIGVSVGLSGFALSIAVLMDSASAMFWTSVFSGPGYFGVAGCGR